MTLAVISVLFVVEYRQTQSNGARKVEEYPRTVDAFGWQWAPSALFFVFFFLRNKRQLRAHHHAPLARAQVREQGETITQLRRHVAAQEQDERRQQAVIRSLLARIEAQGI